MDKADNVDTVAVVAVGAWAVFGAIKVRKVFRLWNAHELADGLTIRNREYAQLVDVLNHIVGTSQEIITCQTEMVRRFDGLELRVSGVEARLPQSHHPHPSH